MQIHRDSFETNAQIIRQLAPVVRDIVPTFDFVKRNNEILPADQIAFVNHYLDHLNQSANILPFSNFILGNNGETTPEWLILSERSILDRLLDLWPDGFPQEILKGFGDGTVLKKSAYFESGYDSNLEFNLNHHQIINDPAAIRKIFEILDKSNIQISGPDLYPEDNLLIFYLASPATLKVNGILPSQNDLQFVVIPNPSDGNYQAEINGIDDGIYHLYVGQISPASNFWNTYEGEIINGETKKFVFEIDLDNPLPDPLSDANGILHLESAKKFLEKLYNQTGNKFLLISLLHLNKAIEAFHRTNWQQGINKLESSLYFLSFFRRELKEDQIEQYHQAGRIMEIIIAGWESILRNQGLFSERDAQRAYQNANKKIALAIKIFQSFERSGREISKMNVLSIKKGEEFLNLIKERLDNSDFSYVQSYSFLVDLFAQEGLVMK